MSWYDAIRIYRERTGNRQIPTLGSPELAVVQRIYNELRNPILRRDLEPEPVRSVVSPLPANSYNINLYSLGSKSVEITPEELEAEENKKRELVAQLMLEQAKRERETLERSERERLVMEEINRKKIELRNSAPKKSSIGCGRQRCKKTGERVRIKPAQIISFD